MARRKRPRVKWEVSRDRRATRPGSQAAPKKAGIQWEARQADRLDAKPKKDRGDVVWESEAARLQGGSAKLPTYREITGLTPEVAERLVPGTLMFLTDHIELDPWNGENWPVPLVNVHTERSWDKSYDPKREALLTKGGMVIYAGSETVDAQHAGHRNVRMDIHRFIIADGIYALMNFRLVRLP